MFFVFFVVNSPPFSQFEVRRSSWRSKFALVFVPGVRPCGCRSSGAHFGSGCDSINIEPLWGTGPDSVTAPEERPVYSHARPTGGKTEVRRQRSEISGSAKVGRFCPSAPSRAFTRSSKLEVRSSPSPTSDLRPPTAVFCPPSSASPIRS